MDDEITLDEVILTDEETSEINTGPGASVTEKNLKAEFKKSVILILQRWKQYFRLTSPFLI
jgi:hypothetical protein